MLIDPGNIPLRLAKATLIHAATLAYSHAVPIILPHDRMEYLSYDTYTPAYNSSENQENGTSTEQPTTSADGISVMWYLVSFGGLVTFFLLLSFSEFCCKKTGLLPTPEENEGDGENPPSPPPYELFAPPSYESLFRSISDRKRSFRASVYLIPVHDKAEVPRESPLEFGEVIRRNPMGDGEVVTPPPPP